MHDGSLWTAAQQVPAGCAWHELRWFPSSPPQIPGRGTVITIGLILSFVLLILKLNGRIDWSLGLIVLPAVLEVAIAFAVVRSPFWWRDRRR